MRERDVTCFRKKVYPVGRMPPDGNPGFQLKCAEIWNEIKGAAAAPTDEDAREKSIEIYRGNVSAVRQYLDKLDQEVGHYVDSASGKILRIEGENISLKAFSSESIIAQCDNDPTALDEDMLCPITKQPRPTSNWRYSTRRHMLEPERPEAV
jgi:hypothetical protein